MSKPDDFDMNTAIASGDAMMIEDILNTAKTDSLVQWKFESGNFLSEAIELGVLASVSCLIRQGSPLKVSWAKTVTPGWDALNQAICSAKLDVAEVLVQEGADVNSPLIATPDRTPLGAAVHSKDSVAISLIHLFCQAGAQVNALDSTGLSALHYAAEQGFTDRALALLSLGADPYLQTPDKRNAFELAEFLGKEKTANAMKAWVASNKAHDAIDGIKSQGKSGWSPL